VAPGLSKDAVTAIGLGHEVERLPEFDALVQQQLRPLMTIVVGGAVRDQQMALQAGGEIDGRALG
jgi:hypothetical protein